jgi:hypothetical protein
MRSRRQGMMYDLLSRATRTRGSGLLDDLLPQSDPPTLPHRKFLYLPGTWW